jgi:hypothetical protein
MFGAEVDHFATPAITGTAGTGWRPSLSWLDVACLRVHTDYREGFAFQSQP